MKCYSYIVSRDYGFAPNPFGGKCTLATCKPGIRKFANIGDWVIGTGSKKYDLDGRLIYAMQVTEKMSFNQYWFSPQFQFKKPIMHGSLKQTYGDNIYYFDEKLEKWYQEDSHHSYADGILNKHNLKRDTKSDSVLISDNFYFFGKESVKIPTKFKAEVCIPRQGYKKVKPESLKLEFIDWIQNKFETGYHADPFLFSKFERYKGFS